VLVFQLTNIIRAESCFSSTSEVLPPCFLNFAGFEPPPDLSSVSCSWHYRPIRPSWGRCPLDFTIQRWAEAKDGEAEADGCLPAGVRTSFLVTLWCWRFAGFCLAVVRWHVLFSTRFFYCCCCTA